MPGQPICEYLDVSESHLRFAVRLTGEDRAPGDRFVLRMSGRWRGVVATATSEVVPRVNTLGVWVRSAMVFELPVDDLPDGSFRLELVELESTADGGEEALSSSHAVPVQPSPGLLAASRPTRIGRRRVQVFPAAGRPVTWVRVAADTTPARALWRMRNVLVDVAFAAHARRFTWVRTVRLLTRPLAPRGPVWLIGERPETARDNGRALFAHLRASRPTAHVYYVIAADSPMRSAVDPLGQVIIHSSWRHRLMMLHADVLINAYSIKHMLPSRWHPSGYMRQGAWRIGSVRVYLKHGVHLSPYAVKRASGGYDLVATVGDREAEALAATSGYRDQLVVTGLARYDALVPPAVPSRTILFMPTWRRYLAPTLFSGSDETQVAYEGSTYERFMTDFLGSEQLADLLEAHDLTLQVVPHYNLRTVLRTPEVVSARIDVLDAATADIPALLRSCDLLVTDYSSVQFDVAYVGTPMVYCQFDEGEYTTGHSAFSWFDPRRDGFGPVTCDADTTVSAIEHYAERGFVREAGYGERVRSVFAHQDHHNCERLVESIDSLTRAAGEPGSRPRVLPG
ncbi:CDP-glycerol glycerophosphotransferase family protein [Janibacter sp. GS2]|uniref:CDP-glycerol glycerophosphotransferase family protein n=1 Tax=Janibacter sp. GS2 TaxID=3442646 RepID=UPI003EBAECA8